MHIVDISHGRKTTVADPYDPRRKWKTFDPLDNVGFFNPKQKPDDIERLDRACIENRTLTLGCLAPPVGPLPPTLPMPPMHPCAPSAPSEVPIHNVHPRLPPLRRPPCDPARRVAAAQDLHAGIVAH